jgi:hypothetical protein
MSIKFIDNRYKITMNYSIKTAKQNTQYDQSNYYKLKFSHKGRVAITTCLNELIKL